MVGGVTTDGDQGPVPPACAERRAVLAENLRRLRERIGRACQAAGRDPAQITVIAVTKTFPASDIRLLHELGIRDIGENRDQEARAKRAALAGEGMDPDVLRWHFVGALQTNKCRSVARYAALVHSVDRPEQLPRLAAGARDAGRVLPCLIQVNLDPPAVTGSRRGVPPAEALGLADLLTDVPELALRGVMGIAPVDGDPRLAFETLAEVAHRLHERYPDATIMSAGMSGDLEAAIAAGATHVRVGAALLGPRPAAG